MCECETDEGPKVFRQTWRRGLKAHRCDECGESIPKRAWHAEVCGLWDDTWDRFRQCVWCTGRIRAFIDANDCHPPLGNAIDTITECLLEDGDVGPKYIRCLREAKAAIREELAAADKASRERQRAAGVAREERKRALACLGEGI